MVNVETDGSRKHIGEVGKDHGPSVPETSFKDEIMRRLMDDDVKAMIRESSNTPRAHQAGPPVLKAQFPEPPRQRDLQRNH